MQTQSLRAADLMALIGFTPDDLTRNRQGYLSDSQKSFLRHESTPFRRMLRIVGGFAAVMTALLVIFAINSRELLPLLGLTLMLTLFFAGLAWWRLCAYNADMEAGTVGTVEEHATVRRKSRSAGDAAYALRIGGFSVQVSRDMAERLDAGTRFRVYYAPRTKRVVAVERGADVTSNIGASHLLELESALGFTPADLHENRAGQLSIAQKARMRRQLAKDTVVAIIASSIAATLLWLIVPSLKFDVVALLGYGLVLIFPVTMAVGYAVQAVGIARELHAGTITSFEGVVRHEERLSKSGRAYITTHWLILDGAELQVSSGVYDALQKGGTYRIYYSPHRKRVLTAEPA